MELKFVDCKSELSYVTLLPKITFKYCNNSDGKIYATYSMSTKDDDIVGVLIDQLLPIIVNKKNAIVLNLLVNPFFDILCDYLLKNSNIAKSKINLIKKHIFSYFADEYTKNLYSNLSVDGAEIYIKHDMYIKSKKMLELL